MFTAECVRILGQTELTVIKLSVHVYELFPTALPRLLLNCVRLIENLSFVVSFWIKAGSKIVKKG